MKKFYGKMISLMVVVLIFACTGCGITPKKMVFTDKNKAIEITATDQYEELKDKEDSILSIANESDDTYVGIMVEGKQDLADNLSLEEYVQGNIDYWTTENNTKVLEKKQIDVNGKKAISLINTFEVNSTKLKGITYIIEADKAFYIIDGTTKPSNFDKVKEDLAAILNSFAVK